MGENIWEWSNWQWTNFQNINSSCSAIYIYINKPPEKEKWVEDLKQSFLQERHTGGKRYIKRCSTSPAIRRNEKIFVFSSSFEHMLSYFRIPSWQLSATKSDPGLEDIIPIFLGSLFLVRRSSFSVEIVIFLFKISFFISRDNINNTLMLQNCML